MLTVERNEVFGDCAQIQPIGSEIEGNRFVVNGRTLARNQPETRIGAFCRESNRRPASRPGRGGENQMSYNRYAVLLGSILTLSLASGTAWADHTIASNARTAPGQLAPITQSQNAASGDVWAYCTWMASACMTGSFDAILRQNHVLATHATQVATAEFPALQHGPAGRSSRNLSLVSSAPGRFSPLPAHNNRPTSTRIRLGVFPDAGDNAASLGPVGEVQTGVFEGPERFLDEAEGDNPRNAPRLGFWRLPVARGQGTASEEPHADQERQVGKKGWGHWIWSRSRRDR